MERARNNLRSVDKDESNLPRDGGQICVQGECSDTVAKITEDRLDESSSDIELPRGTYVCGTVDGGEAPLSPPEGFGPADHDDGPHSCTSVACSWPCEHHAHSTRSRDFSWFPNQSDAIYHQCQYCSVLEAVAGSYCADHRGLRAGRIGLWHSCTEILVHFGGSFVSHIDLVSSCGSIELELGLSREAEQVWPQLPIQLAEYGIAVNRSADSAIALCREWMRICDSEHLSCTIAREDGQPRRVLDCRPDRSLRLCSLPQEPAARKYMALSYCWGTTRPPKTEDATLSQHEESIPWNMMPQLYQDAIVLARRLDIPFLWIDSLCIVQDNDVDRNHEIARMGAIFESAFIVLIAAASQSPEVGFLHESSRVWNADNRFRYIWRDLTTVHYGSAKLDGVKFRERVHDINYEIDACSRERIAKRAWTYQERKLARRCLIMRGREMVWECKAVCWCECSGDQSSLVPQTRLLPQLLHSRTACTDSESDVSESVGAAYSVWHDAVRAFTSRRLSLETDRLPAISALASRIAGSTGDTYLAGLWKRNLVSELMWVNDPSYEEVRQYSCYIAPSWSWASTPARTRYWNVTSSLRAEVVEAWCETATDNPFGPVTDGAIVLNAVNCCANIQVYKSPSTDWPMIWISLPDGSSYGIESNHSEFSFLDGFRVAAVPESADDDLSKRFVQRIASPREDKQDTCHGNVCLLWLADDVCLILAYSMDDSDSFTRLGILDYQQAPPIPALEPTRIRIV